MEPIGGGRKNLDYVCGYAGHKPAPDPATRARADPNHEDYHVGQRAEILQPCDGISLWAPCEVISVSHTGPMTVKVFENNKEVTIAFKNRATSLKKAEDDLANLALGSGRPGFLHKSLTSTPQHAVTFRATSSSFCPAPKMAGHPALTDHKEDPMAHTRNSHKSGDFRRSVHGMAGYMGHMPKAWRPDMLQTRLRPA